MSKKVKNIQDPKRKKQGMCNSYLYDYYKGEYVLIDVSEKKTNFQEYNKNKKKYQHLKIKN